MAGKVYNVTIAKKKDPKKPGQSLSMGYGFVQFYKKQQANEALKSLQNSTLHEKALELKRSDRGNM
jgi:multiple RNA-binding domain-containing protein 1